MKLIIPCAGFGTRMKMKRNQSKEMLIAPGETGPIIDYALDIANFIGAEPLVISRKDKSDLNDYLLSKEIDPLIITPKGEWMDSVLASRKHWDRKNILIFPDTRWESPKKNTRHVSNALDCEVPIIFGMHKVNDHSKWCVRHENLMFEKNLFMNHVTLPPYSAFGLMGFRKQQGQEFFNSLSQIKYAIIDPNAEFIDITDFKDLTREYQKLCFYSG